MDPKKIVLENGLVTPRQLDLIFRHLPMTVTYIDEEDTVCFQSEGPEAVFDRSKNAIGRKVQTCHPHSSLDKVQRILDEMRSKKRESAEFWLQRGEQFVHIRYFAVTDKDGAYKGCLELAQDVSRARRLQGEKRLLDD